MTKIMSIGATAIFIAVSSIALLAQILRACRRRTRAGVCYAALLSIPCAAQVNNFYVNSATGSDSNPGTITQPWATIAHADSALTLGTGSGSTLTNCGDTYWAGEANVGTCVHISAGTYSGRFVTSHNGSSSQRIVFISEGRWGAKIVDGQSSFSEGDIWQVQGTFQTFVGFDLSGNNSTTGFSFRGANNHIFLSHVHDISACNVAPGFCTVPDGGSGIAFVTTGGPGAANSIADSNVIHEIGPYANCQQCTSGSFGCNGVHGIYMQTANDRVTNNIIYHSAVNGLVTFHAPTNDVVSGNTVFANGCALHGGGMQFATSTPGTQLTTSVTSNAILSNGGWGLRCDNLQSDSIVQGNNSNANAGGNYSSCLTDSSDLNIAPSLTNFNANPAVPGIGGNGTVLWSNADYHPTSSSGMIAKGTTNCAAGGLSPCSPSIDFDQLTRTGTPWIGAYQNSGGTAPQPPNPPTNLTATVN